VPPIEQHFIFRAGWLRASVLGANDGIVSTASLLAGIAASGATREQLLIVGISALIAGAVSMAAGEYISVSSQADMERSDLILEGKELAKNYDKELDELANIYIQRGVSESLAKQVAGQLMEHDALDAHARDELGITQSLSARPFQAAYSSALAFSLGALWPVVFSQLFVPNQVLIGIIISTIATLMGLGALSAKLGGAPVQRGITRVSLWGTIAMLVTTLIGHFFSGSF
jgi:VIT1/CCC1 family predicted Fe2+/Mn2+ transporter